MEGALIARDKVGIQDFVLLDETTDMAFMDNLKKRFDKDLIYVSLGGGDQHGHTYFCITDETLLSESNHAYSTGLCTRNRRSHSKTHRTHVQ